PYILMHTSGKPEVMQQQTQYNDVVKEVYDYLSERLKCLYALNVTDVIIDVGFGFGKTIDQNYELLRNIAVFKTLDCPLLVALSRKTMFWKFLEITPAEALNATTIAHTYALLQGINLLRVHDVKAAKEAIKIVNKLK
ncbi:MAG TPA: dihydropteroate synthase, partial [Bacteroidales bacterium]|nr:dihydropteroate synthase [Bacteroidales bacterium]